MSSMSSSCGYRRTSTDDADVDDALSDSISIVSDAGSDFSGFLSDDDLLPQIDSDSDESVRVICDEGTRNRKLVTGEENTINIGDRSFYLHEDKILNNGRLNRPIGVEELRHKESMTDSKYEREIDYKFNVKFQRTCGQEDDYHEETIILCERCGKFHDATENGSVCQGSLYKRYQEVENSYTPSNNRVIMYDLEKNEKQTPWLQFKVNDMKSLLFHVENGCEAADVSHPVPVIEIPDSPECSSPSVTCDENAFPSQHINTTTEEDVPEYLINAPEIIEEVIAEEDKDVNSNKCPSNNHAKYTVVTDHSYSANALAHQDHKYCDSFIQMFEGCSVIDYGESDEDISVTDDDETAAEDTANFNEHEAEDSSRRISHNVENTHPDNTSVNTDVVMNQDLVIRDKDKTLGNHEKESIYELSKPVSYGEILETIPMTRAEMPTSSTKLLHKSNHHCKSTDLALENNDVRNLQEMSQSIELVQITDQSLGICNTPACQSNDGIFELENEDIHEVHVKSHSPKPVYSDGTLSSNGSDCGSQVCTYEHKRFDKEITEDSNCRSEILNGTFCSESVKVTGKSSDTRSLLTEIQTRENCEEEMAPKNQVQDQGCSNTPSCSSVTICKSSQMVSQEKLNENVKRIDIKELSKRCLRSNGRYKEAVAQGMWDVLSDRVANGVAEFNPSSQIDKITVPFKRGPRQVSEINTGSGNGEKYLDKTRSSKTFEHDGKDCSSSDSSTESNLHSSNNSASCSHRESDREGRTVGNIEVVDKSSGNCQKSIVPHRIKEILNMVKLSVNKNQVVCFCKHNSDVLREDQNSCCARKNKSRRKCSPRKINKINTGNITYPSDQNTLFSSLGLVKKNVHGNEKVTRSPVQHRTRQVRASMIRDKELDKTVPQESPRTGAALHTSGDCPVNEEQIVNDTEVSYENVSLVSGDKAAECNFEGFSFGRGTKNKKHNSSRKDSRKEFSTNKRNPTRDSPSYINANSNVCGSKKKSVKPFCCTNSVDNMNNNCDVHKSLNVHQGSSVRSVNRNKESNWQDKQCVCHCKQNTVCARECVCSACQKCLSETKKLSPVANECMHDCLQHGAKKKTDGCHSEETCAPKSLDVNPIETDQSKAKGEVAIEYHLTSTVRPDAPSHCINNVSLQSLALDSHPLGLEESTELDVPCSPMSCSDENIPDEIYDSDHRKTVDRCKITDIMMNEEKRNGVSSLHCTSPSASETGETDVVDTSEGNVCESVEPFGNPDTNKASAFVEKDLPDNEDKQTSHKNEKSLLHDDSEQGQTRDDVQRDTANSSDSGDELDFIGFDVSVEKFSSSKHFIYDVYHRKDLNTVNPSLDLNERDSLHDQMEDKNNDKMMIGPAVSCIVSWAVGASHSESRIAVMPIADDCNLPSDDHSKEVVEKTDQDNSFNLKDEKSECFYAANHCNDSTSQESKVDSFDENLQAKSVNACHIDSLGLEKRILRSGTKESKCENQEITPTLPRSGMEKKTLKFRKNVNKPPLERTVKEEASQSKQEKTPRKKVTQQSLQSNTQVSSSAVESQENLLKSDDKMHVTNPKWYPVKPSGRHCFPCTVCRRKFYTSEEMTRHLKTHTEKKNHKCHLCPRAYTQKAALKLHIDTHHEGKKPFECSFCGKLFRQKVHMKTHIRSHTGEKPFRCDECGKSFTRRDHLLGHENTHSAARPFQCKICHIGFKCYSNLTKHMRIHLGDRRYTCQQCGASFIVANTLRMHLRTHTGEKPINCSICNSNFRFEANFRKHVRIHHPGYKLTGHTLSPSEK